MKKYSILAVLGLGITLNACSQIPSECDEVWDKMEKLAESSGMPKEAVKAQKEQFDAQIKSLPKDDAAQTCKAQLEFLE